MYRKQFLQEAAVQASGSPGLHSVDQTMYAGDEFAPLTLRGH